MRLKPRKQGVTRDPEVCSAARCKSTPSIIHAAGILDSVDVHLCDRHWVAYCAETEPPDLPDGDEPPTCSGGRRRHRSTKAETVSGPNAQTQPRPEPHPADELPLTPPGVGDANAKIAAMLNPRIRNLPAGGLRPGAYVMQSVGDGEVEILEGPDSTAGPFIR